MGTTIKSHMESGKQVEVMIEALQNTS